jgi:flagella basal body P-ring formation protein FlgA
MTSSAKLAGLFLLAAAQAAAQQARPVPAGSDAALPPLLVQRVAGAVAERWAIAPEQVRLEWTGLQRTSALSGLTQFKLLGRGEDGWFAVLFEPAVGAPLAARLHAGIADSAAIAARPLSAGALLTSDDVRYEMRVRWQQPNRSSGSRVQPGDLVRRPIATGEVLSAPSVVPAPLVTAGASVRVEWRRGDVVIELQGTAVNAASAGEVVQVRVDGRTGQLRGTAVANNLVRVGV